MKKNKEEKIIDNSFKKLKELSLLYKNSIASKAYEELLLKYIELAKRYDKTLKINDSIGKKLIANNFNLQDRLNYSIDYARNKLLYNIEEHRRTKRTLFFYENRAKLLEEELKRTKNFSFLDRLENIDSFMKQEIIQIENININPLEDINIGNILDEYSQNNDLNNLHVIKIKINDFVFLSSTIKEKRRIKEFLLAVFKCFKNSFHKQDKIIHLNNEKFCIISSDFTTEKLNEKLETLNQKRTILGFTPSFSIKVIKYKRNESLISFEKRCDISIENNN